MNKVEPKFSEQDVKVESRQTHYDGYLKIQQLGLTHKLVNGGWSPVITRELQVEDAAIAILLYDPARDEAVLVRQFRVGMIDEEQSPWLLEIVAGMIEEGEAPIEVAQRETAEEADLLVSQITPITEYYNSPGTTNEKVYLYCGKVDSSLAGGVHGLDQEHEDIEVVVIKFDELVDAVESGHINNAMTIIATLWLEKHKEQVTSQWHSAGQPSQLYPNKLLIYLANMQ